MTLKELKFKKAPLCNCPRCNGSGLMPHVDIRICSNIGIVCSLCHGTGFESMILNDSVKLYINEDTLTIYMVTNNKIGDAVYLFDGFNSRTSYNYKYVMYKSTYLKYASKHPFSAKDFYELGVTSDYIIPYNDFLNLKMPLSYDSESKREKYDAKANEYEITDNKIVLEKVEYSKDFRYNCSLCNGTGLSHQLKYRNDGSLCPKCEGKGFEYMKPYTNYYIFCDVRTNLFYEVTGKYIIGLVVPFTGLVERDDVAYVSYPNSAEHFASHPLLELKDYYKMGISRDEIITYRKFLSGRLPLPIEKYSCPYTVFDEKMAYSCLGNGETCSKYGTSECWRLFYGDAKTAGEKQAVIRRIRQRY